MIILTPLDPLRIHADHPLPRRRVGKRTLENPTDSPLPDFRKTIIPLQFPIDSGPLLVAHALPLAQVAPPRHDKRLLEPRRVVPRLVFVLDNLQLEQILARTLRAAAHGAAFHAQTDHAEGAVLLQRRDGVVCPHRYVPQRTFRLVHQHAVAPVRADGKVGRVVAPAVEEEAFRRQRHARVHEDLGFDAHQNVPVAVHVVAGFVRPVRVGVFVAPGDRDGGYAVAFAVLPVALHELDEGEGEGAAFCDAGPWGWEEDVGAVGAVEDGV